MSCVQCKQFSTRLSSKPVCCNPLDQFNLLISSDMEGDKVCRPEYRSSFTFIHIFFPSSSESIIKQLLLITVLKPQFSLYSYCTFMTAHICFI